jgi:hypothetical protein
MSLYHFTYVSFGNLGLDAAADFLAVFEGFDADFTAILVVLFR